MNAAFPVARAFILTPRLPVGSVVWIQLVCPVVVIVFAWLFGAAGSRRGHVTSLPFRQLSRRRVPCAVHGLGEASNLLATSRSLISYVRRRRPLGVAASLQVACS